MKAKVLINGQFVDFQAAAMLMDDELREELNSGWFNDSDDCSDCQAFVDAYCAMHYARFNEEFLAS